jgi:hypothetical protein
MVCATYTHWPQLKQVNFITEWCVPHTHTDHSWNKWNSLRYGVCHIYTLTTTETSKFRYGMVCATHADHSWNKWNSLRYGVCHIHTLTTTETSEIRYGMVCATHTLTTTETSEFRYGMVCATHIDHSWNNWNSLRHGVCHTHWQMKFVTAWCVPPYRTQVSITWVWSTVPVSPTWEIEPLADASLDFL